MSEAALLAGLVRSPSRLDPTKVAIKQDGPDGSPILVVPDDADAIRVRGFVLDNMLASNYITQAQYDEASKATRRPRTTRRRPLQGAAFRLRRAPRRGRPAR